MNNAEPLAKLWEADRRSWVLQEARRLGFGFSGLLLLEFFQTNAYFLARYPVSKQHDFTTISLLGAYRTSQICEIYFQWFTARVDEATLHIA